jgi:hypothetical protein
MRVDLELLVTFCFVMTVYFSAERCLLVTYYHQSKDDSGSSIVFLILDHLLYWSTCFSPP